MKLTLEKIVLEPTSLITSSPIQTNDLFYSETEPLRSAMALVINDRKEVLLVQIACSVTGIISWELPGGAVNSNETPSAGVARKVFENTNFYLDAEKLLHLGHVENNNFLSSDITYLFLHKITNALCKKIFVNTKEILDAKWVYLHEIREAILNDIIIEKATKAAFSKARALGVI